MNASEPSAQADSIARQVIGAAIEVHRHLGPGYLESVYEEALVIELGLRGISFERQAALPLRYKGHPVREGCLDLLIADELIVELKAVDVLAPIHKAQIISYLKAMERELGLLINFNVPVLKQGIKRVALSRSR